MTGELHFQVHPCGVSELLVDPLPEGAKREGALYPDGTHLTDLKEVRDLLYKMQRPAIAPKVSVQLSNCLRKIADAVCVTDHDSSCILTIGTSLLWKSCC